MVAPDRIHPAEGDGGAGKVVIFEVKDGIGVALQARAHLRFDRLPNWEARIKQRLTRKAESVNQPLQRARQGSRRPSGTGQLNRPIGQVQRRLGLGRVRKVDQLDAKAQVGIGPQVGINAHGRARPAS